MKAFARPFFTIHHSVVQVVIVPSLHVEGRMFAMFHRHSRFVGLEKAAEENSFLLFAPLRRYILYLFT